MAEGKTITTKEGKKRWGKGRQKQQRKCMTIKNTILNSNVSLNIFVFTMNINVLNISI